MSIVTKKIEVHWNFLMSIEKDLENLSRYIEFHKKNFECYSLEISRILMACSAEVDVVCKQLSKKINNDSKAKSIHKYREEIIPVFNNIPNFRVTMPRYGLNLTPWQNWRKRENPPLWWTAYNKIKHHRHTHYHHGNLHNALNSAAALFIMTLYLYKEKAELGALIPSLKILNVTENNFGGISQGSFESSILYRL